MKSSPLPFKQVGRATGIVNVMDEALETVRRRLARKGRVLVIAPADVSAAIQSTGLLSHFIRATPSLQLSILCEEETAPVYEAVPCVAERFILPNEARWLDKIKAVFWTSRRYWPRIVDLRGISASKALLHDHYASIAGIEAEADEHPVARYARLAGLARPVPPTIWFRHEHLAFAAKTMPREGPVVGIGASAAGREYRWPTVKFADLLKRLTEKGSPLSGAKFVLFGPASDRDDQTPLRRALGKKNLIDLVGRADLLSAAACLDRVDFFIGNASEYLQLAVAADRSSVALISANAPAGHAPWGDNHKIVRGQINPFDPAVKGYELLALDDVHRAVLDHWRRIAAESGRD